MKKILAIMASLTIMTTSAATVVACGPTNSENKKNDHLYDTVSLKKELREKMILRLKGDQNLGFDLNDFWSKQNLETIIDNYIDDAVSKLYTERFENSFNQNLNLENKNQSNIIQYGADKVKSEEKHNVFAQEVNDLNQASVLMTFLTQYTASLSNGKSNALELRQADSYGTLNPIEVDGTRVENVSIYYKTGENQWTRWTALTDLVDANTKNLRDVGLGRYIPDQALLTAKAADGMFALVQNSNELNLTALPGTDATENNPKTLKTNVSGEEALSYRFQRYLRKEQKKNFVDFLGVQLMRSQLYRFAAAPSSDPNLTGNNPTEAENAAERAVYYNNGNASHFVRAQHLDYDNTTQRENFSTDYKMVWTISLNNPEQIRQANQILNEPANQDTNNRNNNYGTYYRSQSVYGFANGNPVKGNSILQILRLLTALDGNALPTEAQPTINRINTINQSTMGIDPVFGIKGFQGFVKNSGEDNVEALLGANLSVDESAKAKIARVNGPAILKNLPNTANGTDFAFKNPSEDKANTNDFIVVLPLYLADIWKKVANPNSTTTPTPAPDNQTSDVVMNYVTNQWVRLLPQVAATSNETNWQNFFPTAANNPDWTEVSEPSDTLPTKNSFRIVGEEPNKEIYVYLTSKENTTLKVGTVDVKFQFNEPADNWDFDHNFGLVGIGDSNQVAKTNGQLVKFNVHLGFDNNTSDNLQIMWAANRLETQQKRSDDVAYFLDSNGKEALLNIMLNLVGRGNNEIIEAAKKQIYIEFINPNDIYFNALYERLIPYIKVEESEEASD